MTLSSDTDQSRYRVWDYPIKEQYTHIFKVHLQKYVHRSTKSDKQASNINANANYYFQTIKNTGMVKNAKEGFEKVLADEDGTFAFIHEASQVRQCNINVIYIIVTALEHHQR